MAKEYTAASWEERFLELYRASGNVSVAARGAGVVRTTVYERRKSSKQFAGIMDTAREEAIERLEAEAWKRAKTSSDTLLIFLLKSLKPDTYRENQNVKHEGDITITVKRG